VSVVVEINRRALLSSVSEALSSGVLDLSLLGKLVHCTAVVRHALFVNIRSCRDDLLWWKNSLSQNCSRHCRLSSTGFWRTHEPHPMVCVEIDRLVSVLATDASLEDGIGCLGAVDLSASINSLEVEAIIMALEQLPCRYNL